MSYEAQTEEWSLLNFGKNEVMTWASHIELRLIHQGGKVAGCVAPPYNEGITNENVKEKGSHLVSDNMLGPFGWIAPQKNMHRAP